MFTICRGFIVELCVELERLRHALRTRFEILEEAAAGGEDPTDDAERVLFTCRKKRSTKA